MVSGSWEGYKCLLSAVTTPPATRSPLFRLSRPSQIAIPPIIPHPPLPAGVNPPFLLERTPKSGVTAAPPSAEPDPVMERRELASEYYRQRNNMIKQYGGFTNPDPEDETLGELMEERDGKVKKVSRFKAARIQRP